jgi:ATP/maltotriose-dependent transcriptional regulator MalT
VAALDRVRPGISARMGPLLGPRASPSFEPLMTALINEVAGQPDADQALLLVLDDYHVISSQLVSHVLGKLGAANRTEAVTRARELGLIP